jgi:hypothetical protein
MEMVKNFHESATVKSSGAGEKYLSRHPPVRVLIHWGSFPNARL